MKYLNWKLDWSNGEGVDPTTLINSDTVRVEPQFATGNLQNVDTTVYAYWIKGDIDVTKLTKWSVKEVSLNEMFEAAQLINQDATLVNGLVRFPVPAIELEMFA